MTQNGKSENFDIAIIGAGSGGLTVAAVASQLGHKVALIEKDKMGGDCLNYGCVPSKALLAAAKVAQVARDGVDFGIDAVPLVDFKRVMKHVHGVIAQIEPHDSQERFEGLGVTVIREAGKFLDADTLQAGERIIKAKRFVVATGSYAFVPPIEGLDKTPYLTNENIFELEEKPEHLLILGGGPIGVEMAQAFKRLNSAVTVFESGAQIMGKDDPEAAAVVADKLTAEGVVLNTKAKVSHISATDGGVMIVSEDAAGEKHTTRGSHILIATGRAPNVDGLGLDKANVEFDKRGIKVNAQMRTSNKKIFAVGDVVGGYQFTHIAGYEAGLFIQRSLFGNIKLKANYSAVPWVTYTSPELAQVGLKEDEARAKFGAKLSVTKVDFAEVDRAQAEGDTKGFIKVMSVKGRPVGVTIVGKEAGEMLPLWSFMITHGRKLRDISALILPYPSRGEVAKRVLSAYYKQAFTAPRTGKISRFLFKLFG